MKVSVRLAEELSSERREGSAFRLLGVTFKGALENSQVAADGLPGLAAGM